MEETAWLSFSENYFCLLPGEEKTVTVCEKPPLLPPSASPDSHLIKPLRNANQIPVIFDHN